MESTKVLNTEQEPQAPNQEYQSHSSLCQCRRWGSSRCRNWWRETAGPGFGRLFSRITWTTSSATLTMERNLFILLNLINLWERFPSYCLLFLANSTLKLHKVSELSLNQDRLNDDIFNEDYININIRKKYQPWVMNVYIKAY